MVKFLKKVRLFIIAILIAVFITLFLAFGWFVFEGLPYANIKLKKFYKKLKKENT